MWTQAGCLGLRVLVVHFAECLGQLSLLMVCCLLVHLLQKKTILLVPSLSLKPVMLQCILQPEGSNGVLRWLHAVEDQ